MTPCPCRWLLCSHRSPPTLQPFRSASQYGIGLPLKHSHLLPLTSINVVSQEDPHLVVAAGAAQPLENALQVAKLAVQVACGTRAGKAIGAQGHLQAKRSAGCSGWPLRQHKVVTLQALGIPLH